MINANEILEYERNKPQRLKQIEMRRARIIALVLAAATIVSLIFLVYAFIQKKEGERLRQELMLTQQELEKCQSK